MKKTKVFYLVVVLAISASLLSAVNALAESEEARRHMARGQAAVEMAKSPEEYAPAIKEFQEASRLAPDWPDPHYNLGLVQEKSGKFREAVASLKEYLRLAPDAPDASNIKELIYKLEYKAEQVLSVHEIIDVLVSFSDKQKWQQYDGECIDWSLHITREGDDVVKALNAWLYYPQHKSYKTLNVTGPTLKYISTINICDASANREFGGCDSIIENKMEVVSMTLVKINQKVIRAGTFGGVYRDGDERSCKYRKK
jgi:tetratricopeptide (TPR) repeat protein